MQIEDEMKTRSKRTLSVSSQTETSRGEIKISKADQRLGDQSEQMEVDTPEQINQIETLPK